MITRLSEGNSSNFTDKDPFTVDYRPVKQLYNVLCGSGGALSSLRRYP